MIMQEFEKFAPVEDTDLRVSPADFKGTLKERVGGLQSFAVELDVFCMSLSVESESPFSHKMFYFFHFWNFFMLELRCISG